MFCTMQFYCFPHKLKLFGVKYYLQRNLKYIICNIVIHLNDTGAFKRKIIYFIFFMYKNMKIINIQFLPTSIKLVYSKCHSPSLTVTCHLNGLAYNFSKAHIFLFSFWALDFDKIWCDISIGKAFFPLDIQAFISCSHENLIFSLDYLWFSC